MADLLAGAAWRQISSRHRYRSLNQWFESILKDALFERRGLKKAFCFDGDQRPNLGVEDADASFCFWVLGEDTGVQTQFLNRRQLSLARDLARETFTAGWW